MGRPRGFRNQHAPVCFAYSLLGGGQ
jgi:hypothetical protein